MTREEKQKAIDTLKISSPFVAVTQEEYNDYIQTINQIIDWLEQEPTTKNDLGAERHKQNLQAYAHDFGVSEEQAKKELAVKNDLGVDCISRQDVLSEIIRFSTEEGASVECQQLYCDVNNMPSVTPQEPRKGHWEHGKELGKEYLGRILVDVTYEDWHCSNCNYVIKQSNKPKWNYCPNCGADMRGEEV